jgi:hypothetical protein
MSILHKQLCDTDCGRLPDIGILVAHTMAQGLDQTCGDLVDVNITHGADSESTNQRVGVLDILCDQVIMLPMSIGVVGSVIYIQTGYGYT